MNEAPPAEADGWLRASDSRRKLGTYVMEHADTVVWLDLPLWLCLHRLRTGPPDEPGETLFDPAAVSAVGQQVQRLTGWAGSTTTGDRDELVPGVEERAWRQVSVSARECLGAQRCPFGSSCFAERAREAAGRADIVVTNHALLAIDALEEFEVLPEHDVVIIDEAHDLVNRVTSAAAATSSALWCR